MRQWNTMAISNIILTEKNTFINININVLNHLRLKSGRTLTYKSQTVELCNWHTFNKFYYFFFKMKYQKSKNRTEKTVYVCIDTIYYEYIQWTIFQCELNKIKDYSINNYNTEIIRSSIQIFLAINHPIVRNQNVKKWNNNNNNNNKLSK